MQDQAFSAGLQPVEMTHTGAGDKCEEKEAAERSC